MLYRGGSVLLEFERACNFIGGSPVKPRILIVDDNDFIRDLIKSFLVEFGAELFEAANGQEAIEQARSVLPDLILLDLQMPLVSGYDAAEALRQDPSTGSIPILIVTGIEHAEAVKRITFPYDGFLSKPFKKADLLEAIINCRCRPEILKLLGEAGDGN